MRGESKEVIKKLQQKMSQLAADKEYEKAAKLRDQVANLRQLLVPQRIERVKGDFDVVVLVKKFSSFAVQILKIRSGSLIGSKVYFPESSKNAGESDAKILQAFLMQYYFSDLDKELSEKSFPKRIILNLVLSDQSKIAKALSESWQKKVLLKDGSQGKMKAWVKMAKENGLESLKRRFAKKDLMLNKFAALKEVLALKKINRVECFDVSHTFGQNTVASCVVFDENGPSKKEYRIFNIKLAKKSDDYGALREVLTRRYQGLVTSESELPNVVLIDGGKGQIKIAITVFKELDLLGKITLLAIAKGEGRRPGLDTLYQYDHDKKIVDVLDLKVDSLAFHLMQEIRDAAHRFAITRHRNKNKKIIRN